MNTCHSWVWCGVNGMALRERRAPKPAVRTRLRISFACIRLPMVVHGLSLLVIPANVIILCCSGRYSVVRSFVRSSILPITSQWPNVWHLHTPSRPPPPIVLHVVVLRSSVYNVSNGFGTDFNDWIHLGRRFFKITRRSLVSKHVPRNQHNLAYLCDLLFP